MTLGLADRQADEGCAVNVIGGAAVVLIGLAIASKDVLCTPKQPKSKLDYIAESIDGIEAVNIKLCGNKWGTPLSLSPYEGWVNPPGDGELNYDCKIVLPPEYLPKISCDDPEVFVRKSNGKMLDTFGLYIGTDRDNNLLKIGSNNTVIALRTYEHPVEVGGILHFGKESYFDVLIADVISRPPTWKINGGHRFHFAGI